MLYKENDWVWFVWKHGIECLPVCNGSMASISPNRRYFHDKPSANVWDAHSILSLATDNNHTIISAKGDTWIYLRSFTHDEYFKRVGSDNISIGEIVRDSTICQLNPKYEHYGHMTKKLLDRDTIHFITKYLEDQPMKGENKVKSVTAKYKITPKTTGTDLEHVASTITLENGETITPYQQQLLKKVDTFKSKKLQPGAKSPVWKRIKYETVLIDGKKRQKLINKWIIIGYRDIPTPKIIVKPPYIYKVKRGGRITYATYSRKFPRPWIDPKTFSGNIEKTTWTKMAPQIYRFAESGRTDVGIKTFILVKYSLKKHLHEQYHTDERILNRLTELRFLKYPRSRFTLRKYAAILNRMRTWTRLERMVAI